MKKSSIIPQGKDAWQKFKNSPGQFREVFEFRTRLLPEVVLLGKLKFKKALPWALWPSRHKGLYEIHYFTHGNLNWWVGNRSYKISSGMILIIFPDELHGSKDTTLQPCEHYWIQMDINSDSTFRELDSGERIKLKEGFKYIRQNLFMANGTVGDLFEKLVGEHRKRDKYSVILARSILHELLVQILRSSEIPQEHRSSKGVSSPSLPVRKAIEILLNNLNYPPTSAVLAEQIGLSETTLRQRFIEELGFSPSEYLTNLRIDKAKELLLSSKKSITDIGISIGFSSSQYFCTAFKRLTGISPKDFRKQIPKNVNR